MARFAWRRVLRGHRGELKGATVWWLLLDCRCTTWRPYTTDCYRTMFCPKHPLADTPAPKPLRIGEEPPWAIPASPSRAPYELK